MSPLRRPLRGRPVRIEPAANAPSPSRSLALNLVGKAHSPEAPGLDQLLEEARLSGLYRSDDLALAREIALGVCRQRVYLETVLAGFLRHPLPDGAWRVRDALLVGIYQARFLDRIPAHSIVDETVRLVGSVRTEKTYRGLANAIMRRVVGEGAGDIPDPATLPWPTRYSIPDWLASAAGQVLPTTELEEFFAACNSQAPLNLRRVDASHVPPMEELVGRLKGELVDQLGRLVEIQPGHHLPDILLIDAPTLVPGRLPSFQAGHLTAEDEGAALVGWLAGAKPGMRILDLCAAPGGKTAQLVDLALRKPARMVATDVNTGKLDRLQQNLTRLQLGNLVETKLASDLDGESDQFDLVLVDAPCSGLGTLRRHPEARWRRTGKQFRALVRTQREILEKAVGLLAPGGTLVYSVCTFNERECDGQAQWLGEKHPDLRPLAAPENLPFDDAPFRSGEGRWRTFTHRHGCDSFFVTRWRKES